VRVVVLRDQVHETAGLVLELVLVRRIERRGDLRVALQLALDVVDEVRPGGPGWIQSLDQDDSRMVTDHPETDHAPEWSPDGRSIAFHSDRGASTSIWILDTEDGSLTQLTDDSGNDHYPDWSPDGRYITFSSDRAGNHDIWIKPVSKGSAIQVTTDPASDTRPSWSTDGKTLAFTSDREKSMDIWVVDAPALSRH
jgi:Tol biopolymer transport system component